MCTNNCALCYLHAVMKCWGFEMNCGLLSHLLVLKIAVINFLNKFVVNKKLYTRLWILFWK
jgi:hypothetical protein